MNKIIKEFHIPKYTVMVIDKIPEHDYYYVMIDGKNIQSFLYTILKTLPLLKVMKVLSAKQ